MFEKHPRGRPTIHLPKSKLIRRSATPDKHRMFGIVRATSRDRNRLGQLALTHPTAFPYQPVRPVREGNHIVGWHLVNPVLAKIFFQTFAGSESALHGDDNGAKAPSTCRTEQNAGTSSAPEELCGCQSERVCCKRNVRLGPFVAAVQSTADGLCRLAGLTNAEGLLPVRARASTVIGFFHTCRSPMGLQSGAKLI
jgi:hypothetical protein